MTSLSRAKRLLKYFDLTYLKNRALYLLASNPPVDDGYYAEENIVLDQRPPPQRWDVSQLSGTVACPSEKGLFLHRQFVNHVDLQHIESFVKAAAKRRSWFTYHVGRDMMPVNSIQRPQDAVHAQKLRSLLLSLKSANNTDPKTWTDLGEWCDETTGETSLPAVAGARVLASVQERIQKGSLLPAAVDEPCLFVQMQNVVRGGVVGSHIDNLVKGGKCICTLIVNGTTDVRVGNIVLKVEPGDIYGIEEHARYNVEHEVYSTVDDRLTATFRFGHEE